jgi:hypothetical protein
MRSAEVQPHNLWSLPLHKTGSTLNLLKSYCFTTWVPFPRAAKAALAGDDTFFCRDKGS